MNHTTQALKTDPVPLEDFNKLRFPRYPQSLHTLRYRCRTGHVPGAFKLGDPWFVYLVIYDRSIKDQQDAIMQDACSTKPTKSELDAEADALYAHLV